MKMLSPRLRFDRPLQPSIWRRWKWIIVASAISWSLVTLYTLHSKNGADSLLGWTNVASNNQQLAFPDSARRLWAELLPLLEESKPDVETPKIKSDAISVYWEANIEFDLMDKTEMKQTDIIKMARAHRYFTTHMSERLPHYIPTKGGAKRGIVTVAGGDYFPAFMVSLRMLRNTNSTLPVEVWMADDSEYESELCETILPQFNAHCRVLTDIFDAVNHEQSEDIVKFQYKIFAILFSSFDEVLFLDSDSFPLRDPEDIFNSQVFQEQGMITWPDLWASSVSPAYYLIADQPPPPIILRASTESGQFLINKKTHFETLLISAYYNYFGPSHYYILLCQGGFGRGDKSTFVPAAIAANQTFYDVSERPRAIGQMYNYLHIFALLQADAELDYDLTSKGIWRVKNPEVAPPVRPFFVHTTNPKWNPARIFGEHDPNAHGFSNDPTRDPQGRPSMAYIDPAEDVALIPGVERQLWEEMRWVACTLEKTFEDWKTKEDICKKVENWFEEFLDVPGSMDPKPIPEKDEHDEHFEQGSGKGDINPVNPIEIPAGFAAAFHAAGVSDEQIKKIMAELGNSPGQTDAKEKGTNQEDEQHKNHPVINAAAQGHNLPAEDNKAQSGSGNTIGNGLEPGDGTIPLGKSRTTGSKVKVGRRGRAVKG